MGLSAGSVRIRLNLPTPPTLFAEMDRKPVEDGVRLILGAVEWIASDKSVDDLQTRVNDDRLTRLVLDQIRRMAPSPNGKVNRVEFAGTLANPDTRYILSHRSVGRIRDAVAQVSARSQTVTEIGKLRTADLDSGSFQLRQRPDDDPDLRCFIPRELMAEATTCLVEDVRVALTGQLTFDDKGRPYALHVDEIYELPNVD